MTVRLITAILLMHALGALAADGAKGTAPNPDPWGVIIFLGAVCLFLVWFAWHIIRDSKNRKNRQSGPDVTP